MTSCVKKLQETSQTMEDLYNAIVTRDPKADCYTYFDENGAPKTKSYEDFANSVFTTASKLSGCFSSIAPGTIVGLKLKNSPRAVGCDRIYVPGEKEFEAEEHNNRCGIPLDRKSYENLQLLAEKYRIEAPAAVTCPCST